MTEKTKLITIGNAKELRSYIENTYSLDELSHSEFRSVIESEEFKDLPDIGVFKDMEKHLIERISLFDNAYKKLGEIILEENEKSGLNVLHEESKNFKTNISYLENRLSSVNELILAVKTELNNSVKSHIRYDLSKAYLENEMGLVQEAFGTRIEEVKDTHAQLYKEIDRVENTHVFDCSALGEAFFEQLPEAVHKIFEE